MLVGSKSNTAHQMERFQKSLGLIITEVSNSRPKSGLFCDFMRPTRATKVYERVKIKVYAVKKSALTIDYTSYNVSCFETHQVTSIKFQWVIFCPQWTPTWPPVKICFQPSHIWQYLPKSSRQIRFVTTFLKARAQVVVAGKLLCTLRKVITVYLWFSQSENAI